MVVSTHPADPSVVIAWLPRGPAAPYVTPLKGSAVSPKPRMVSKSCGRNCIRLRPPAPGTKYAE